MVFEKAGGAGEHELGEGGQFFWGCFAYEVSEWRSRLVELTKVLW